MKGAPPRTPADKCRPKGSTFGYLYGRGQLPMPVPPDRPVRTKEQFTEAELKKIVADELTRQPKEWRCWLR